MGKITIRLPLNCNQMISKPWRKLGDIDVTLTEHFMKEIEKMLSDEGELFKPAKMLVALSTLNP